jgi:hypothetical protein
VSQFVLDDHLGVVDVRDQVRRWSTATFLRDIRPGEVIEDERIPSLLQTLRTPTFITIDKRFRDRAFRDRRYCIVYFDFNTDEQRHIPDALRRLLRCTVVAVLTRRCRRADRARSARGNPADDAGEGTPTQVKIRKANASTESNITRRPRIDGR